MNWRKVAAGSHRIMPWKNGGGSTAEIAIGPTGASVAAGFDWRLSIATVAQDGPFSAFPGYDRVITLLSGKGMVLTFDGTARRVLDRPFRPLAFAGERETDCHLIAGDCEDLNLMVARSRFTFEVGVLTPPPRLGQPWRLVATEGTRLLFLFRGQATATSGTTPGLTLGPRDTAIAEGPDTVPDLDPSEDALAFYAILYPSQPRRQAAVR